jgi:hypothetical protein
VFEEREYQSLGQWEEDGKIYTYTKRRDVEGHEVWNGDEEGASVIPSETVQPKGGLGGNKQKKKVKTVEIQVYFL